MKIGIVGTGTMGTGIAQVAARAGHQVFLYDARPEVGQKALAHIAQALQKEIEKGRMIATEADALMQRIAWIDALEKMRPCNWVIEAIVEDLVAKKAVFTALEEIVSTDCILATNTSSLSVSAIAASCRRPERVLGIHFFNPVPVMQLVELIPAVQTAADLIDPIKEELLRWNKIPVIAKDTPGFIVNRIARPYYTEALRMLDEGIADCATIDLAMTSLGGFRMGPFLLMDFIGHDVNFRVTEGLYQSCYQEPRYRPSFSQKRLFEAGYWGKKTGRGFYDYSKNLPVASADQTLLQQIFKRILLMLINEAADAQYWKIASPEDLDLAMTKGMNFPKGLLQWADEWGIEACVRGLDELYSHYHEERYRCSMGLRKKVRN
ncbi:3-hydroxyacyl-CoA dehydrogenase NAD-binding domain-containing protein [Haliscomenobacter hydrossis]|uniref:3-hydroxybutyryl-CoA dehydrogenase n=1 Tax=Haliscomenobacter hydrossis (strain ATCC 27775 / DSM 1100 / LMG 10767 / O) TaxID=760192 RepID=F4L236_HALH1|nr:3-hydroxyacyl-CoA dehydrogenase NAD-binding domain-containing protein [Haliscomenobacter hydrossis]AEE51643.1 3-hydroxybutyryl-CoA dehydrogenase [Haliscomenobacter hydrossis DSM 1100]